MGDLAIIGIDLAKSVIQFHGSDKSGKCIYRKKLKRHQVLPLLANSPKCLIGMEACSGSHYWAREIQKLGHEVKLIPPQFVKPYVKTNKTDAADAEAICEAVARPNMRFVPIKTPEQQGILLVHRERDGLIKERTAVINRIRAALGEFGIAIPAGPKRLKDWISTAYGQHQVELSSVMTRLIDRMIERLSLIESEISALDKEIDGQNKADERCMRLLEIPGVGRLTASAIVASVGNAKEFKSGRQFSAWLGLVPRQHSSGGKQNLQGISKRGDAYIRKMLIHGARAIVRHMNKNNAVVDWIEKLSIRRHHNVVIVAVANKLARIAWALLSKEQEYSIT
ncbi:MAG: IS110 family transposase [Oceanospirillaceae bacterium]|nr:IS110 family transposase [Oceanospirillaceae bacterium]